MIKRFVKSIMFRMFGFYLIVILAFGLSIFYFSFNSIRSYYMDVLTKNLVNIASALSLKITPLVESGQFSQIDSLVKELDKSINARITITGNTGNVLADSENNPGLMENHKDRYEISKALSGETSSILRFSRTQNREMLYVAAPLIKKGRVIAVIRLSMPTSHIDSLLKNLKNRMFHALVIISVVSLVMALMFSNSLYAPIQLLARGARKVASGDYDTKVFLKRDDEFKLLAESFNYMTGEIKMLFDELSRKKEELNSVISSMQSGLLVLDNTGRIVIANESVKNILNEGQVRDRFYWEIIRDTAFNGIIKKTAEEQRNTVSELELNNKRYICSSTIILPRNEIVVILQDITEIKNIEAVKRDFVANVSHELKTPLTAIKGYVETLEEEKTGQKHQLNIVARNIDRLINIVQDLITLSKLEDNKAKPVFQRINLEETIRDLMKIFEKQIKEKGLNLKIDAENNLLPVKGDPFQLEQLFMNLLDNAVKYTEKGEINIVLKQRLNTARIEISDTGIGIPVNHLGRIFERFYVADKSRSRNSGGTGLGLSIVKHIVQLHGGTVSVESVVGKGTVFTVTLPSAVS